MFESAKSLSDESDRHDVVTRLYLFNNLLDKSFLNGCISSRPGENQRINAYADTSNATKNYSFIANEIPCVLDHITLCIQYSWMRGDHSIDEHNSPSSAHLGGISVAQSVIEYISPGSTKQTPYDHNIAHTST